MSDGRYKAGVNLVAGVGHNDGKYPSTNTKEHSFMIDILFFGLLLTHTVILTVLTVA